MRCEVDPIRSSFLTGRVNRQAIGAKLELLIDGQSHPPLLLGPGREFTFPLPSRVFDGSLHEIRVRLEGSKEWFAGCPLTFQSKYQGYVHMEAFAGCTLTGWVLDTERPTTSLDVEILLHGREAAAVLANAFRPDIVSLHGSSGYCGFLCRIDGEAELENSVVIRARVRGTHFDLHGSPVLYINTSRFLKALYSVHTAFRFISERTLGNLQPSGPSLDLNELDRKSFCDLLLGSSSLADLMELSRWLRETGRDHIANANGLHRFYTYLSADFPGSSAIRHPSLTDSKTDVILYVHSYDERVEECFRRLLASPPEPAFTVICVVGAAYLRPALKTIAASHDVVFIEHKTHLGFGASINRAASIHTDRDIVILDSETYVSGAWLAHLRSVSANSPAVGIVTPFATRGEICNYPAAGAEVSNLEAIVAGITQNQPVDVPATNGLCTYIRRACLSEVGQFDLEATSVSRRATVDFCLRAAARGWRTVLASRILVDSPQRPLESEEDLAALNRRHPFYNDSLINFQIDDPALECRRNIDVAILQRLTRPICCVLTHNFGGGTERHVRDLGVALDKKGMDSLVIFSLNPRRVALEFLRFPSLKSLKYNLQTSFETLVSDLSTLNISHFHIHSNIDAAPELFTLPERLGVPYDCTIHDYSWFCPRVNLIDGTGVYCGEPDVPVCEDCVRLEGAGFWTEFQSTYGKVANLREQSQSLLSGARQVFCPSLDVKFRMQRQLGLGNLVVRGNLEPDLPSPAAIVPDPSPSTVGVGLIGFISRKKGMDLLLECAQAAQRDELPLRFVVIGYTENDARFSALPNVTITGRYLEGQAPQLIRDHRLQLALLPTLSPETYSFTLSIAIQSGLYPVAFDLGALSERIRVMNFGRLLPLHSSPEEINAALMEAATQSSSAT
jgi:glycosyltransferase involved in cell wall biosynthesis